MNWLDERIREMEKLTDNMMKELNVLRSKPKEFCYESSLEGKYLDWCYGMMSKRFDQFFHSDLEKHHEYDMPGCGYEGDTTPYGIRDEYGGL